MGTTFIYTLSDPRTDEVRYVGKSNDPVSRLKSHMSQAKTHKGWWIKNLVKSGFMPVMDVIDEVPDSEWAFWEQHWIQVFSGWGFSLTNGDAGGLGTGRSTPELKAKISKTLSGRTYPERWRRVAGYTKDGMFAFEAISKSAASDYLETSSSNVTTAIRNGTLCGGYMLIDVPDDCVQGSHIDDYETMYRFPKSVPPYVRRVRKLSNYQIEALRKANLGRRVSEETRSKQSSARIGKSPANKGISLSAEKKAEIQKSSTCSKKVFSVGDGGFVVSEWVSIKDASKHTSNARHSIKTAALNNRKTPDGLIWWLESEAK